MNKAVLLRQVVAEGKLDLDLAGARIAERGAEQGHQALAVKGRGNAGTDRRERWIGMHGNSVSPGTGGQSQARKTRAPGCVPARLLVDWFLIMGADQDPSGTVTLLLREMRAGSRTAFDELFRLIQHDLRRFAQSMLGPSPRHDTSGTELVNMACARLLGRGQPHAEDRGHLFFLLGRAMRDTLVEEARKRSAAMRGGGQSPMPLVDFPADERTARLDVLDLHAALSELEARDPDGARVIELRFFAGLTLEETAEAMGCTLAAVRSHWNYARAWLSERLSGPA